MRGLICATTTVVLWAIPVQSSRGQQLDRESRATIVQLVEGRLRAEVEAFEAKDCTRALQYYADDAPLFVSNGRATASREDLAARCPSMVARIPVGMSRPVASQSVRALGPTSAYSVTEYRIPGAAGRGGPLVAQFVTKIWELRAGEWLIVHVHESVQAGSA